MSGDPLGGLASEFVFGIAELAGQLPDAGALGTSLGVGHLDASSA